MPIHLRELPKGQRFVLMRTGDKFVYLGVGVSPYSGSYQHLCQREYGDDNLGFAVSVENRGEFLRNTNRGIEPPRMTRGGHQ